MVEPDGGSQGGGGEGEVLPTVLTQDVVAYAVGKRFYQILGVVALWCLSRQPWIMGSGLLHRMAAASFFIFLTHEPTVSILQTRLLAVWRPEGAAAQLVAWLDGAA